MKHLAFRQKKTIEFCIPLRETPKQALPQVPYVYMISVSVFLASQKVDTYNRELLKCSYTLIQRHEGYPILTEKKEIYSSKIEEIFHYCPKGPKLKIHL